MLTFLEALGRLATFAAAVLTILFGAAESWIYGVTFDAGQGFHQLNAFTLNRLGLGLLKLLVAIVVSGVVFGFVAEIFGIQNTPSIATKQPVPAALVTPLERSSSLRPGRSEPYIA